jgi:hypothetical protein
MKFSDHGGGGGSTELAAPSVTTYEMIPTAAATSEKKEAPANTPATRTYGTLVVRGNVLLGSPLSALVPDSADEKCTRRQDRQKPATLEEAASQRTRL